MTPAHWTKATLADLCDLVKGTTPIQKSQPGPYPLVTTGEHHKTADHFQFDADAVCVPMISSTGHGHASLKRVHFQSDKFALANLLTALLVRKPTLLLPRFLALYLNYFKDQLIVPLMMGAANMSITVGRLATVLVAFPTVKEQWRILDVVDEVARLRGLRDQADRRTIDIIPSIFREMFGDSTSSNLNRWQRSVLRNLTTIITSGSRGWAEYYSETGARFIRVQDLAGNRLVANDIAFVNPPDTSERERARVCPDDILLAITGATIGLCAVASDISGEAYLNCRTFSRAQTARFMQFLSASNSFRSSVGSAELGLIMAFKVARRNTAII